MVWAVVDNPWTLSDAYMRRQIRPSLVQIAACHLFEAKPLSEPTMDYYELDPIEHFSVKYESKLVYFRSKN